MAGDVVLQRERIGEAICRDGRHLLEQAGDKLEVLCPHERRLCDAVCKRVGELVVDHMLVEALLCVGLGKVQDLASTFVAGLGRAASRKAKRCERCRSCCTLDELPSCHARSVRGKHLLHEAFAGAPAAVCFSHDYLLVLAGIGAGRAFRRRMVSGKLCWRGFAF